MSMMMRLASEEIETYEKREKHLISVIGCGRVGLLTACLFADSGFRVTGVDVNQRIVEVLKRGKSPFTKPQLTAFIKKCVKDGRLDATTETRSVASNSDVIIINVPVHLDKRKKPDYSTVERACNEVGMGLRSGSLIIVQSVMGPGVTETLVKETLERASGLRAGVDFGLAYCPVQTTSERDLEDIAGKARIIGAINEQSMRVACLVLGMITKGEIVRVRNIRTAEAANLFKNISREVNVALANELAKLCEKKGIDFFEARAAINTKLPSNLEAPGIAYSLTSNCLSLLVEEAETVNMKLPILRLSRKTNEGMLKHALHLARDALKSCGKNVRRAKFSVLGVSRLPNLKEPRGSPTKELVKTLRRRGARVKVYDPLFSYKELIIMGYPAEKTLTKTVEGADCIVVAVGHNKFRRLKLRRIKVFIKNPAAIVDMGQVIDPDKAEKVGFVYRGVGRGVWTK